MFKLMMAMVLALVPFVGGERSVRDDGPPIQDTVDEWICDGSGSDHCNPAY